MGTKSTGYNRSLCFIDDIYFCGIVKVVHVFTDFAVLTALICHQSICIIVCLLGSFKYSVHKKTLSSHCGFCLMLILISSVEATWMNAQYYLRSHPQFNRLKQLPQLGNRLFTVYSNSLNLHMYDRALIYLNVTQVYIQIFMALYKTFVVMYSNTAMCIGIVTCDIYLY